MRVTGAWHTGFTVADLDRSLAFYRDLLGFELRWRRVCDAEYIGRVVGCPGVVMHQALLAIPGSDHLFELNDYRQVARTPVENPGNANPGTAHISLLVDDLPALHAKLVDAGVEVVSDPVQPTEGPNTGSLVAYVVDPDSIRVELVQGTPAAALA